MAEGLVDINLLNYYHNKLQNGFYTNALEANEISVSGSVSGSSGNFTNVSAYRADVTGYLVTSNMEISNALKVPKITTTTLTTTSLDASTIKTSSATVSNTLTALYGDIKVLSSYKADIDTTITARRGEFDTIKADHLDVDSLATDYLKADGANITNAIIKKLFVDTGVFDEAIINNGTITGYLDAVHIRADSIVANKISLLGPDGLYYALNTEGVTGSGQTLENALDGSHIIAESITASKIKVTDLFAFQATIGGWNIDKTAIRSALKTAYNDNQPGVYLGSGVEETNTTLYDQTGILLANEDGDELYFDGVTSSDSVEIGWRCEADNNGFTSYLLYSKDGIEIMTPNLQVNRSTGAVTVNGTLTIGPASTLSDGTNANDAINGAVSNASSAVSAVGEIQETIDNLEIGGRNILRATETMPICTTNSYQAGWEVPSWYISGTGSWSYEVIDDSPIPGITKALQLTTTAANTQVGIAQGQIPLKASTVTQSVWAKVIPYDEEADISCTLRLQPVWVSSGYDWTESGSKSFTITDSEWHRYTFTKDILYDHPSGRNNLVSTNNYANGGYVYFLSKTVGDAVIIVGNQLEYGDIATSWTPAHEDTVLGGGTNLLTGTESMSGFYLGSAASLSDGVITLTGSSSNYNGTMSTEKFDIDLYDGETIYTWSFEYCSTADVNVLAYFASTAQAISTSSWSRTKYATWIASDYNTLPSTDGKWVKFSYNSRTLDLQDLTAGSGDTVSGYLQLYARTDNATIQIRHMKLEKGTKATDWTPAPEDVQLEIDNTNSNITDLDVNTDAAMYGTITYQYTHEVDGEDVTEIVYKRLDETYYYITIDPNNDEINEVDVNESDLTLDESGSPVSVRADNGLDSRIAAVASELGLVSGDVEGLKNKLTGYDDYVTQINNSLVAKKYAVIDPDTGALTLYAEAYDTGVDLSKVELTSTGLILYAEAAPVAYMVNDNGIGVFKATNSQQTYITMTPQDKSVKPNYQWIAQSNRHLSLKKM